MPGSDGSFDKVDDFSASINNGQWSASLATLLNDTGDVAYVVPAARSTPCCAALPGRTGWPTSWSLNLCLDSAGRLPAHTPVL